MEMYFCNAVYSSCVLVSVIASIQGGCDGTHPSLRGCRVPATICEISPLWTVSIVHEKT